MITAVIKNPNHVMSVLEKEKQYGVQASKSAIKQESARLKKLLQKEIKEGSPGGRSMAHLGAMAMETKRSASDRNPLARLRHMMGYDLNKQGSTWFAKLGLTPYKSKSGSVFPKGAKISWARIMELQQAGVSIKVTDKMRRKFLSRAIGSQGKWQGGGRSGGTTFVKTKTRKGTWSRAGRSGGRVFTQNVKKISPYFIRKTGMLKIPGRPIIVPFWAAHKSEAMQNLQRNFKRIMGGQKRRVLNK